MYKLTCEKGNIELNGHTYDNLSDVWESLMAFKIGFNLMQQKHPAEYKIKEVEEQKAVDFIIKLEGNREYIFRVTKE